MNFLISTIKKPAATAFLSVLLLASAVTAGSLTPPGAPAGTMNTLAEVYDSIVGVFNSSSITANQNGSLMENLKYIESQLAWASNSNNVWLLSSGNVGIGDSTPEAKFEVVGVASVSQLSVDGTLISFFGVASNSLDFDEFVDSMTLDANLAVASAGYTVNWKPYFASSLLPAVDNAHSLGDSSHRWRDLYLGPGTLHIGLAGDQASVSYAAATNRLQFGINGAQVLLIDTVVNFNTTLGSQALRSNISGLFNTAVGAHALYYNTTGTGNVANGFGAMFLNVGGSNNTAVGQNALYSSTSGFYNTAIGSHALYSSTGSSNAAVGYQALYSNTTGGFNTAIGESALNKNTIGFGNTANGGQALYNNTTGFYNSALGYRSLIANTTGSYNATNGYQSLYFNTTGSFNVALGTGALRSNTSGSDNVAVGASAGYSVLGSGNIFLGRSAGFQEHGSNTLWIDNQSTASSSAFIYGELDNDWLRIGARASISGNLEVGGRVFASRFDAAAGSISSVSYGMGSGFTDMGMVRAGTTLLVQNKDTTPDLAGRSRLSLGEEFFNLAAVRSENTAHTGNLQCYDEAGSTMICRFDVTDGTNTGTTRFLPTRVVFGTGASMSGNFIPGANDTYDLGSSALRWRDLYLGPGSLHLGTNGNEAVIGYDTTNNYLTFKPDGSAATLRLWDTGAASLSGTLGLSGLHVHSADLAPMYSVFEDTSGISSIVLGDPSNGTDQKYFGLTYYGGVDSLKIGGYSDDFGVQVTSIEVQRSGNVYFGGGLTKFSYDIEIGDMASVGGNLYLQGISATAAGDDYVCRNPTTGEITFGANCTPSSIRFKENIQDLEHGLDWVSQLRPVTFDWKHNGSASLGFIAEEVERVSPLLALYQNGEIFSVNYQIMTAVLAKAIQEQQATIEALQAAINAPTIPLLAENDSSLLGRVVRLFADMLGIELSPNRIRVQELCLDDVCVTKDELRQLLEGGGVDVPEPEPSGRTDAPQSVPSPDESNRNAATDGGPTGDMSETSQLPPEPPTASPDVPAAP